MDIQASASVFTNKSCLGKRPAPTKEGASNSTGLKVRRFDQQNQLRLGKKYNLRSCEQKKTS